MRLGEEVNASQARASLERAQTVLDRVVDDNAKIAELLPWLEEVRQRVRQLESYCRGQVHDDLTVVFAHDPAAVTPPVGNEDAAWEALVDFEDLMKRALRVVTSAMTSSLDEESSP